MYAALYVCIGTLPVNIDVLLIWLPGATKFGIGVVIASSLFTSIISILFFGYYGEKLSEKYSRKNLFILTNLGWVISYGLTASSLHFISFLIFFNLAAAFSGAFLPVGFSIIGDFYPPEERGKRFGWMSFGLILGTGGGIIFGGLLGSSMALGGLGWRLAYIVGAALGLASIIGYFFRGIEPERGREEPEFKDLKEINYNYKITYQNLKKLFKSKSTATILIFVLTKGIATTTLGAWAIFYFEAFRFTGLGTNAGLFGIVLYLLAGLGALPGTVLGGKIGDRYFEKGKLKGRATISFLGMILGMACMFGFYLLPFSNVSFFHVVLFTIIAFALGFVGSLLTSFPTGNQFAVYSEVCVPEVRGTANALNGMMINIGGIFGNVLLSALIETNLALLPFTVALVLLIWFFGSFLWLVSYFYHPKEAKECQEIMQKRRVEMERNQNR